MCQGCGDVDLVNAKVPKASQDSCDATILCRQAQFKLQGKSQHHTSNAISTALAAASPKPIQVDTDKTNPAALRSINIEWWWASPPQNRPLPPPRQQRPTKRSNNKNSSLRQQSPHSSRVVPEIKSSVVSPVMQ